MSGNEDQKKTKKANEVLVVLVPSLIQQEEIEIAKKEERDARSVNKSGGNEQGEDTHNDLVNVETVAWPRLNPCEAAIFE